MTREQVVSCHRNFHIFFYLFFKHINVECFTVCSRDFQHFVSRMSQIMEDFGESFDEGAFIGKVQEAMLKVSTILDTTKHPTLPADVPHT